jgi:hypothetical protein
MLRHQRYVFAITDYNVEHFILAFMCDIMHDYYTEGGTTNVPSDQFQLLCEACSVGCQVPVHTAADIFIRAFRIQTDYTYPVIKLQKMERTLQNLILGERAPRFTEYDKAGEQLMSDTCRTNEYVERDSACDLYQRLPMRMRLIATPTIVDTGFIKSHVDYYPYRDRTIPADTSDMEFIVSGRHTIGGVRYTKSQNGFYVDFYNNVVHKYSEMNMDSLKEVTSSYLKDTYNRDHKRNVPYQISRQKLFDRMFLVFMLDFAQLMYAHDRPATVVTNDVAMTVSGMLLLGSEVVSDIDNIGRRLTVRPKFIIPPRVPVPMPL